MNASQKLFLIRGLPGAGKTSFAHSITPHVVSADDYFTDADGNYEFNLLLLSKAHEWCFHQVDKLLSRGNTVAVANTFTREWEMENYFNLAKEYQIPVFAVIVENRHGSESIHDVPQDAIDRMRKRFQVKL